MILLERLNQSKFKHKAVKKIITAFIENMEELTEKKVGHLLKGVALELARTFPEDQKVIYLLFEPVKAVRKKGRVAVTLSQPKAAQEGTTIIVDQGCEDCGDDVISVKTQSRNKNVLIVPAASSPGTLPASAHGDVDGQHAVANKIVKLNKHGDIASKSKATPMEVINVKSPSYIGNAIGKNMGVTTGDAYKAAMEAEEELKADNPDVSPALIKDLTAKPKEQKKGSYNVWNDATQWTDIVDALGADPELLWDFIVDNVNDYTLNENETKLAVLAKVILGEIELRRRGKKS